MGPAAQIDLGTQDSNVNGARVTARRTKSAGEQWYAELITATISTVEDLIPVTTVVIGIAKRMISSARVVMTAVIVMAINVVKVKETAIMMMTVKKALLAVKITAFRTFPI